MNIEQIREYCLSLPVTSEDCPFGEEYLAFRVKEKIFAMIDLNNPEWFVLKCHPDTALVLRETHSEIKAAWHMNKKHWNQIDIFGLLPDTLIKDMIRHSYEEVVAKMPKKIKTEHPELMTVSSALHP
ncbi:MAG: MmcQ/YjbR family DNA-binding protein [Bacteroidales bacterium]|nr:MmcQ/YjbR family DNA-binding protein [Bacteroidales bacterium]MCM1148224.1 MmcQ/YjbR family DNA-binding protein [Bacteroidales bacterium]MCM1206945.1 MmcQ/YjbR family DNA-binding protein [Bacillota bacterium]MCM1511199.1 MmcQ/YjbR family DNA-binding protein [Clostridium sp.]